jgi:FemAB family protein
MTSSHLAPLQQAAARRQIELLPLTGNEAAWDAVLGACAYAPVSHTRQMVAYQHCYAAQSCTAFEDCSVVIRHARQVIGVWPLNVRRGPDGSAIGSNEGPVLPPLFAAQTGRKLHRAVIVALAETLDELAAHAGSPEWAGSESFGGEQGCSEWHLLLMERGARLAAGHEIYADLGRALVDIKSALRKSYKSLLTEAERHWRATIHRGACDDVFDEFRRLHLRVAGRATRSMETWDRQMGALRENAAFLVSLHDADATLVGAGLFHVSPHEALYAVGAYDRSLFDKPLGHLVQWRALQEMQRLNLRWYKLGARPYPGESPAPNAKELSIAHFKQGFASHVYPRWMTHLSLPENHAAGDPS